MNTQKTPQNALEDIKVSLKLKPAMQWVSFMFLYIYVDCFALYMPGKIEDILTGIVFEFGITQGFLLAALASVTIPALMIFCRSRSSLYDYPLCMEMPRIETL